MSWINQPVPHEVMFGWMLCHCLRQRTHAAKRLAGAPNVVSCVHIWLHTLAYVEVCLAKGWGCAGPNFPDDSLGCSLRRKITVQA